MQQVQGPAPTGARPHDSDGAPGVVGQLADGTGRLAPGRDLIELELDDLQQLLNDRPQGAAVAQVRGKP